MKGELDHAEMLRICNRQKARCMSRLEAMGLSPEALNVVRNAFGFLRNDLIESTKPGQQGSKEFQRKAARNNDASGIH